MKMGGKAINVLVSDCHIYKKSKSQKVSSPPHQSVSSVTARLIATTVATQPTYDQNNQRKVEGAQIAGLSSDLKLTT
jgi:hypothetical protein